jgi:pimeloyl-ACP methyl ester carboxylesterase
MAEMAADAMGLAEHLGWDSVHVAGVSMGGMIAQHVALGHRSRVRSLSLLATTSCGTSVRRPPFSTIWIYLRTQFGKRQQRLTALSELLYSEGYRARCGGDELLTELAQAFGHEHPGTWQAQYAAVANHDVRDELHRLADLPSLVIGAGLDRLVPVHHAEDLHKRLPTSELLRFGESGHGVIAEHTVAVADAVRRLVVRTDVRSDFCTEHVLR